MKNAINYYYNISPEIIHQSGKVYRFNDNESNYILAPFDLVDEINQIYELSNALLQQGIYCHQIMLNNSKEVLTKINNILYVLMRIFVDTNKEVTLNDIIYFSNIKLIKIEKINLRRNDWFSLWTKKIDYFEYQVNQLGKKYPVIRESFSYFVGLAENAISLFASIPLEKENLTISHRRIRFKDTLFDLYNPLNFIIDVRIRDVCEYFKSEFIHNKDVEMEIMNYLYYAKLSNYECILFFSRMLFPSHYFDIYEKIISNNGNEEELKVVIEKVNDYEKLLSKLYLYFRSNINFPEISWLKKINAN